MKRAIWGLLLVLGFSFPTYSFAKGAPLFFQTGDELFEIEGAPKLEDGYSVGYACKRFGLFGADVWTWDCDIMAINLSEFSAWDLSDEDKAEYSQKFSLDDRERSPWNNYGVFGLALALVGGAVVKMRK